MTTPATGRVSYWLVGSLVANALLVGLLIGTNLGHRRAVPPPPAGAGDVALVRSLDSALDGEDRQAVRAAMRAAFSETREARRALHEARRTLGDVLAAEPYDEAAVRAGFAQLREADLAVKQGLHDALATQLGTLSVAQREAILARMLRRDRGHRRHRSRHSDGPSE